MKKQEFKLTTPVLFLIFNRLDTTKKVFAEIRKAKPKQLFIASDGPRENKPGEKEIVERVRKYVLSHIDWPCEVKTLFREKNLGCKYAVSGAITWFFENVEQGIILEDDCLPSQSFFRFCQELLERYKDEERIMAISGYNLIEEKTKSIKESYLFFENAFIWGWATWKRSWEDYDVEIHKKLSLIDLIKTSRSFFNFLISLKVYYKLRKEDKTWDYQLGFLTSIKKKMWVVPKKNLIENIGFSSKVYTNLKPNRIDIKYLYRKKKEIQFPLIHPTEIKENKRIYSYIIKNEIKRIIMKYLTRIKNGKI